ncbi:MAG TPA: type IX secretion system membrane protein PorP/SprF [Salinivirgaceae bacterium]|nr:type IX secretion system membrane protein PorP/SprF [Salinivirgaceae bacterium]
MNTKKLLLVISFIPAMLIAQDRFAMVFSEQSYLINPSFTAINHGTRLTIGAGYQGIRDLNYGNFQIAGAKYLEYLNAGFGGYLINFKEGLMNHTIVSVQFSRFFNIYRAWNIGVGGAPEIHNLYVSNDKIILASELNQQVGTVRNIPTIWTIALTSGISFFTENQTVGFAAFNIFNKKNFFQDSKKSLPQYHFSYGGIYPLNRFTGKNNQVTLRPHILVKYFNSSWTFFYGTFYGNPKLQVGIFGGSTTQKLLYGINPAIILNRNSTKIILSFKFITAGLPLDYIYGNEVFMQWNFE